MMDVPTFFKEHERMCRYYKNGIDCGGCPIVKKDLIQYEKCFDYCAHYPEEAVAIVEEWAKEHPLKTYKSVFLESFPNAKLEKGDHPYPCITYIYGEASRPHDCGLLDCNDCWNSPYKEIEEV